MQKIKKKNKKPDKHFEISLKKFVAEFECDENKLIEGKRSNSIINNKTECITWNRLHCVYQ